MELGLLGFPGQSGVPFRPRFAPVDGAFAPSYFARGLGPTAESWVVGGMTNMTANSTLTMINSRVHAIPQWIPHDLQIDKIGTEFTTGVATALCNLGIYENAHGHLYPGRLIAQVTGLDASATAVVTAPLRLTLKGGRIYWFAAMAHTAQPVVRTVAVGSQAQVFGQTASFGGTNGGGVAFYTHVAGPLPQTFAPGASRSAVGMPWVAVRVI